MIIIPLAGESKRFQRIGIRTPKWALNVLDTPMIVWAIKSVVPIQEPGEEIILSVRQNNYRTLTKILNDTNFKNISIVKIENPTLGQAHTVKLTIDKKNYNPEERLIIWCGDCYIRNLEIFSRKKLENGIFVANLHGSHWSFSKIERDIIFLTAEKLRLSDYANV